MTSDVRDRILRLLAKAQASPYEAEAIAFAAKAQELMTRYAVDVAADAAGTTQSTIDSSELVIDDPYASARFSLLSAVAHASRCQAIWDRRGGIAHLVGGDRDRAHVELVYTSLLLQATSAMNEHGSVVDDIGRNRTRSFRQAFLVGYAREVSARLTAATESVLDQADASVLPVLATDADRVDAEVRRRFPSIRSHRPSVSSAGGWAAGHAAGKHADLGGPTVPRSTHKGLTG